MTRIGFVIVAVVTPLSILCLPIALARAAKNDWAEGTPGRNNGASRDDYNRAGALAWKNYMGDWRDAEGEAQGDKPFANADISGDAGQAVEFDVSVLVRAWQNGESQNQGFFLRMVDGRGSVAFCSRENEQVEQRPELEIFGKVGTVKLGAEADTYLTGSTYKCQGQNAGLLVSGSPNHALLRFDLSGAKDVGEISTATLRLFLSRPARGATIGVFRCSQGHEEPPSEPQFGLAAKYSGDEGLEDDPDVVFAAAFETPSWHEKWTQAGKLDVLDVLSSDPQRKFEPLKGQSLRVRIAEGSTGALNTLFKFGKETGDEPEEMYFRYYLRLADDWNQTIEGGKLPGFSGTYGVAGWGGRKSNGQNGWSARGKFSLTIPADNPLAGTTPIGTYCYHADMEGFYGTNWIWQNDYRGFLENNRWYCLEQFIKLNTPGEKNGVLRAWVDGRLAFEKTDIRFRLVDRLKIEQVWMNVYHGGTTPSPYDQHLYIDNVVIAKRYVGPMSTDD